MTRPGLTYWRCPECGERVDHQLTPTPATGFFDVMNALYGPLGRRRDYERAERFVEAREARHGIGAA